MQARVVTQLNIRQPGLDTEQRPEKVLSVLLELSLSLFEALELEVEGFLLCDLLWRTAFETAEILLSSEFPFCENRVSSPGKNCGVIVSVPFSKDSNPRILLLLNSSPFQGRFLTSFLQTL